MRVSVASVTVNANGGRFICNHWQALQAQKRPIDEIVVVDNGSTDGSTELLLQQSPKPTILSLGENLGVGAAFSAGLKYALGRGYDWVWLFDHDSQPAPDALKQLLEAHERLTPAHNIGILSCLPVHRETGAEYHGMVWRHRLCLAPESVTSSPVYFADSVASSGSLVRAEAVRKTGFPRDDFFIDYVDHEFNLRLRRHGYQIAVVRQSVLSHRIGQPRLVKLGRRQRVRGQEPSWRLYYAARNQTITVWHLTGGFWPRAFLLLDMCKRAGGVILWDPDKGRRLRCLLLGFFHGIANRRGKTCPRFAQRS